MDAATLLFTRITQHFKAGDGINPDYLLQEFVARRLKSGETVTAYVDNVARKVTLLHQPNGEFTEWQHASLLLSNCVEVYQGLARELCHWINNHDRRSFAVADAVQRLRAVEHLHGQTRQSSQTLKASQVSSTKGNDKCKAHLASAVSNSAIGARTSQTRSRRRTALIGHWYSECTTNIGKLLQPELAATDKTQKQHQK
ncbi:hypothetical protein PF002_g886 [Phytophthora fragariae]|uniref:Uncharacterized protein n=1 Tax=Phytophthora fragariae TaxID=53985 RepID=A0A6A4AM64_9STRA|nr:hypothetical protein PF003_g22352 [Phytophthora fragariae]KAE9257600.1 hypothetical protein PF002_g886 [Phytophthora fragariae]